MATYRVVVADDEYEGLASRLGEAEGVSVLADLGLRHSQYISERWLLSGAIFYSEMGYNFSETSAPLRRPWNEGVVDPNPQPEPGPAVRTDVGHRFHYVSVPLEVAYDLLPLRDRFSLRVRGGAEPGLLIGQFTRLRANDGSRYSRDLDADLKGYSLSLRTSLSLSYQLSSDWNVLAEPTFRQQLTPLSSGAITTRLNSTGLLFGIQRNL